MKKLLFTVAILLAVSCIFVSCNRQPQTDVITVEDGYLVVNGNKTEHKVDVGGAVTDNKDDGKDNSVTGDDNTDKDNANEKDDKDEADVITVKDGYLVVNGVKTEYEVNQEDVITVEDGYLVVNGVKTEYKVHTAPTVTVVDGFIAVNGVKTEYEVEPACDHVWETVTTPPTCTEEGYDTKTCTVCEKRVRTNVVAARSHQFSTEYAVDDAYHWFKCGACDEVKNKELHTPDDAGVCSVCQLPVSSTPGVVYDLAGDGSYAEVIDYTGEATRVKIAAEYEGVPVTGIYASAFQNTAITAVVIPDSVTSIGASAFSGCTSLTSVTIPDSVTSIGASAFYWCSSLASVTIPDSVTSIGDEAFYVCRSLTAVTLGDGVTSIGDGAFSDCSSLTAVTIPDSVTSIGYCAFEYCSSLTTVTIPDSVTSIGAGAFEDCNSALYTEYEYGLYVKSGENPYAVLIAVTNQNMSSYTLHEDTRHIANSVFSNCERLTSITIPDSVTSIGRGAFSGCEGLTTVTIGNGVTSIGEYAFSGCESLTTITIPDSVTSIGAWAFYDCDSLTDVYITDVAAWCSIYFEDYDSNPLCYANNLYLNGALVTTLTIPDGVTSIGAYAFYGFDSLASITIPDSVTSIGSYAFSGCYNLTTVYYGGDASAWENMDIDEMNWYLTDATRYDYSETQPATGGNYWHYVNGVPTAW